MIDLNQILEGGNNMGNVTSIKVGDKVRITDVRTGLSYIDDNLGELVEVIEVDLEDEHLPIRVKFLRGHWEGHCHWLSNDRFQVEAEVNQGIKVGDKVRTTYTGPGLPAVADNLGKLAEVVEVDQGDAEVPIRVKFLSGAWKGHCRWIHKDYFNLVKEVEGVKMDKIKEGDFVVIDTTRSEDSALEGLHGKVVKIIEVDPIDSALPINVALPNGNSRWMYPEEFYTAPTEGFNILVDEDKPKLYRDASGKEVPVLEVDYECGQGLFFEAIHNGELMWVSYKDCRVVRDTDVASELPKEAVEFDFTVMKSYTNGAVNTFLRIDKQSEHFYDKVLLAEFNKAIRHGLICSSVNSPDFVESCNTLYLRGVKDSADALEIPIPDDCLEQVVTTLVDLKAWMLNRCKQ